MSALLPVPFNNPYTYTGHSGVDFPQPKGTPFRASGPGVVSSIDYSVTAGHTVWVKYDQGPNVGYCHMDSRTTDVRVGDRVVEGTVLGRVGKLGKRSTGYHLHVEVAGHATTAGFWRFFTRDRVVGEGSPAGEDTKKPAPKPKPALDITEEDPMRYLIQIDPRTDGRWFLADFGAGTAQRIHNGTQLDLIKRDSRVDQVSGPQPVSVLDGLTVTGNDA